MPGTTINGTDQISASRATINANFALCAPLAAPTFTGDVTLPGTSIVKSTGNVGIGTTSPGNTLHVVGGNALFQSASSGDMLRLRPQAAAAGVAIDSANSAQDAFAPLQFVSSSFAFTTGNVGIGTTAPTSKLQVTGLPVYADNTAALAGGLTAGAFYRTSTGVLMVAY